MSPQDPSMTGTAHPSESTPYHLLQRTPQHRWWSTVLGFAVLPALVLGFAVLLFAVLSGVASLTGSPQNENGLSDPLWEFASMLLAVSVLLPAVRLTVRWVQRRPGGLLSSVDGRLRWRWMTRCALWALLGCAAISAVDVLDGFTDADPAWLGSPRFVALMLLAVVLLPLQSLAEEYVFRGFLLQGFASWWRTPWPGAVLSTLLFVSLHGYGDPLVLADLLLFAMALSWLTIRTGGLEAAIALHVVNNLFAAFAEVPRGTPVLEQPGDVPTLSALMSMLLTVTYTWWIDRLARKSGGDRTRAHGAEEHPHRLESTA